MFKLLEKEKVGTILLNNKVRVSDPCYGPDTWCAGTLENVLKGRYNCYSQSVNAGNWGIRIASIEVRHENYDDVDPTEIQDIDVGVDSGQAGIYDLDYFVQNRDDKGGVDDWYASVCNKTFIYVENPNYVPFEKSEFWKDEFKVIQDIKENTSLNDTEKTMAVIKKITNKELTKEEKEYLDELYVHNKELYSEYNLALTNYRKFNDQYDMIGKFAANTLDDKCLVSSSGDGDGSYTCLVGRNDNGQIVSIKIDYYYGYSEDEEYDEDEYEE